MRKKCTRVKNVNGLNQILIDLKPKRYVSEVYLNREIDVTNLVKYIEEKKKDNENITLFHAFVSAVGKTIYHREKLNMFISNRHLYKHDDVIISFVAKVAFEDSAEEVMVLIPVDGDDNIDVISEKIYNKINKIRSGSLKKVGANDIVDFVGKMPNIFRVPIVAALKSLDKFGALPSFIIEDNIYYSSMMISNVGSLKCNGIYHNLTEFGTCSGLITIGEVTKKNNKYYCEFGVTVDERVADGYYLIESIHMIENILSNPKVMEEKINEKIEK